MHFEMLKTYQIQRIVAPQRRTRQKTQLAVNNRRCARTRDSVVKDKMP